MLKVTVEINGKRIIERTARRLESLMDGQETYCYETDTGTVLFHQYHDGAAVLATKLLAEEPA